MLKCDRFNCREGKSGDVEFHSRKGNFTVLVTKVRFQLSVSFVVLVMTATSVSTIAVAQGVEFLKSSQEREDYVREMTELTRVLIAKQNFRPTAKQFASAIRNKQSDYRQISKSIATLGSSAVYQELLFSLQIVQKSRKLPTDFAAIDFPDDASGEIFKKKFYAFFRALTQTEKLPELSELSDREIYVFTRLIDFGKNFESNLDATVSMYLEGNVAAYKAALFEAFGLRTQISVELDSYFRRAANYLKHEDNRSLRTQLATQMLNTYIERVKALPERSSSPDVDSLCRRLGVVIAFRESQANPSQQAWQYLEYLRSFDSQSCQNFDPYSYQLTDAKMNSSSVSAPVSQAVLQPERQAESRPESQAKTDATPIQNPSACAGKRFFAVLKGEILEIKKQQSSDRPLFFSRKTGRHAFEKDTNLNLGPNCRKVWGSLKISFVPAVYKRTNSKVRNLVQNEYYALSLSAAVYPESESSISKSARWISLQFSDWTIDGLLNQALSNFDNSAAN